MSVDFYKILSDSGIPTTQSELENAWSAEVTAQGSTISNDNAYSPFWRVITALITKPVLWLIGFMAGTVLPNSFVQTATGLWLELLAWAVNLTRKLPSKAQGKITFTRADINVAYTVPAGTIIQTASINGFIYAMITDSPTAFLAEQVTVDVNCTAADIGERYNLAMGYYNILPVPIAGITNVSNISGWLTLPGTDTEADNDLRDRVRNQFGTASNFHTDSVYKSLISQFPGIKIDDIWFEHDAPRGPGTANAFVLFDFDAPDTQYLLDINAFITDSGHHGHGDDLKVYAMPKTTHALTAHIWHEYFLSAAQIATLQIDINNFIRAAFRENRSYSPTLTYPYSRFSFSKLTQELHKEFATIHSITFDLIDIISVLNVPTLSALTVTLSVTE
ncbi:baseplate J/gp47 family protein [Methylobacter sp. S3L5C]|uniref:baseplate J/gp47 family protein n=1 Tax=Methylobacter sp. S3L5C TaxID=2839024 RepID=UPI001FAC4B80|nr:baseplate J/gp47 family protein [Methylobacter sp. S3L5C]UOA08615.1 baseplate J/gp47 family protein [Methylobacter sp. S3L5C]